MLSVTKLLQQQASGPGRSPMIKFLGKRSIPSSLDHKPRVHAASPSHQLPADFIRSNPTPSFSSYRQQAQQHGPLGRIKSNGESRIGSTSGFSLGPVIATNGEYFDRSELPSRFHKSRIDLVEIDAIETGGATLVC